MYVLARFQRHGWFGIVLRTSSPRLSRGTRAAARRPSTRRLGASLTTRSMPLVACAPSGTQCRHAPAARGLDGLRRREAARSSPLPCVRCTSRLSTPEQDDAPRAQSRATIPRRISVTSSMCSCRQRCCDSLSNTRAADPKAGGGHPLAGDEARRCGNEPMDFGPRRAQGRAMGLLEALDSVDWSRYHHAYGPAVDVPMLLRALAWPDVRPLGLKLREGSDVFETVTWTLWSNVYHQGSVWGVTARVIPFLVEILNGDVPIRARCFVLRYLYCFAPAGSRLLSAADRAAARSSCRRRTADTIPPSRRLT